MSAISYDENETFPSGVNRNTHNAAVDAIVAAPIVPGAMNKKLSETMMTLMGIAIFPR